MHINQKMNLVVPLYRGDEIYAYVHSTPLSREAFEANYLLISKTFTAIHDEGFGVISGPRIAHLILRNIAETGGVLPKYQALMAEIRRLSNVLLETDRGWEQIPYDEAVRKGLLDEEDYSEVEGAIVFFTVASAMYRRLVLRAVLEGAAQIWTAQLTSSDITDFGSSLSTSKRHGHTGARSTSIPV